MSGQGISALIPPKNGNQEAGNANKNQESGIMDDKGVINETSDEQGVMSKETIQNKPMEISVDSPINNFPESVADNEEGDAQKASDEKPRYGSTARFKPKEFAAVFQLEVAQIKPNPYQPRKDFNDEELRELGESIREYGVIQPIIVSKIEKETPYGTEIEYQLIAGERRLMASKLIGLPRIPAIIKRIDSNKMKLELALIENIQRSNLNPLETARAYSRLQDEFALTQREIAVRVGKSREVIANTLRLLNLPSYVQEALSEGKINESQARMLLMVVNIEDQKAALAKIINQKLSVRALKENIVATPAIQRNPEQIYWEKQLEEKFGVPVKLVKEGDKGKMVIHFFSDEEMRDILNKLLGEAAQN